MMKNIKYSRIITGVVLSLLVISCSDRFLEQPAIGGLNEDIVATRDGIEKILIGAYGALDAQDFVDGGVRVIGGGNAWEAAPDNWIYGSVVGGDASKGSFGGDQSAIDPIVKFIADPANGFFNTKWKAMYEGISRTNAVLSALEITEDDIPEADVKRISGEARFLRGHYYFELKKMFNMVPWVDENTENPREPQPNDQDIWPMIEADFEYAFENLPATQQEIGRVNNWAAAAYLGKTYLYQHKYGEAKGIFDQVIASGQNSQGVAYNLVKRFSDNFDAATQNNEESVFEIQMVANDGTNSIANSNQGGMLNFPYNSPFRCCGFYQPTQELVNSYKTDPGTGLPYLDNYNENPVTNDMGLSSDTPFSPYEGTLDPRLDWTVGRRGVPYHDWGKHPGRTWVRDQSYGGPYAPKKNIYWQATQDLYADQSSWAPGTAINIHVIRFADVLLMAAEAEAQLGNLNEALQLVNRVRARAADPDGYLRAYIDDDQPMAGFSNDPAANYVIGLYNASDFASQDAALKAIYFERKLELAMEGHRFFDLVRWGTAQQTLNAFFAYQGSITSDVRGGSFVPGRSEYFPIPQRQIDLSTGADGTSLLVQNPGY